MPSVAHHVTVWMRRPVLYSSRLAGDVVTFGAKFVRLYAEHFLKHRHTDTEHQLALLNQNRDLYWPGLRSRYNTNAV